MGYLHMIGGVILHFTVNMQLVGHTQKQQWCQSVQKMAGQWFSETVFCSAKVLKKKDLCQKEALGVLI